ncbi:MAG: Flp family type IVb pilin [Anaerolineae bacterium]
MFFLYLQLPGVVGDRSAREGGQTLTEYALIIMLIALAVILAAELFGLSLRAFWESFTASFPSP